jgi:protein SCO1/2
MNQHHKSNKQIELASPVPGGRRLVSIAGSNIQKLVRRIKALGPTRLSVVFLATIGSMLNAPPESFGQFQPPRGVIEQKDRPAALQGVGIEQKLNERIPLELTFRDETGSSVSLSNYFGDKPVVLALVYYTCPMLCNQELNGLVGALKMLNFTAGNEFNVITLSFDPRDTTESAFAKRQAYLGRYSRPEAEGGWHFLTGDEQSIRQLTDAVGFYYRFDSETNQYVHAGGIMVLTPDGTLSRYFYGIEYSPRDLRLGLVEASSGKIGTAVDQVLLFCYHYDPVTGKYGPFIMNLIRAGGFVTFLLVAILIWIMRRRIATRRFKTAESS